MKTTHYRAKVNGKWVFGSLYIENVHQNPKKYLIKNNIETGTVELLQIDTPLSGLSICTMIRDKDGNYIYEGDYLRDSDDLGFGMIVNSFFPVVYNIKDKCWCINNSYYKNHINLVAICDFFGSELYVDGNIYDNPEKSVSFLD